MISEFPGFPGKINACADSHYQATNLRVWTGGEATQLSAQHDEAALQQVCSRTDLRVIDNIMDCDRL